MVPKMNQFEGCQLPCLPHIADGNAVMEAQPLVKRLKRALAKPWNYTVKKRLKKIVKFMAARSQKSHPIEKAGVLTAEPAAIKPAARPPLKAGDIVRVKSREEIESTLDRWKELRGCAFLEYMWEYCGTEQQVFVAMERFLDERDYKVKKCKGILLLAGAYCPGTPVFGRCDRHCFLFWREEWLERVT
jgi:hypothetical protein